MTPTRLFDRQEKTTFPSRVTSRPLVCVHSRRCSSGQIGSRTGSSSSLRLARQTFVPAGSISTMSSHKSGCGCSPRRGRTPPRTLRAASGDSSTHTGNTLVPVWVELVVVHGRVAVLPHDGAVPIDLEQVGGIGAEAAHLLRERQRRRVGRRRQRDGDAAHEQGAVGRQLAVAGPDGCEAPAVHDAPVHAEQVGRVGARRRDQRVAFERLRCIVVREPRAAVRRPAHRVCAPEEAGPSATAAPRRSAGRRRTVHY
jgi:hypothetical protein